MVFVDIKSFCNIKKLSYIINLMVLGLRQYFPISAQINFSISKLFWHYPAAKVTVQKSHHIRLVAFYITRYQGRLPISPPFRELKARLHRAFEMAPQWSLSTNTYFGHFLCLHRALSITGQHTPEWMQTQSALQATLTTKVNANAKARCKQAIRTVSH